MTDEQQNPPPRENPKLVGHDAVERILIDAWTSGRIPHAWLFTGPRGIGKATLAYRFAKFVLANGGEGVPMFDQKPLTLALDQDNPIFRYISSGSHPDLLTLQRGDIHPDTGRTTDGIVVSQVRKAVAFMRLTPALGGWRVVVIDAADSMNINAANALLKCLEEPPKRAFFILVGHSPGILLPTMHSRCQRLSLAPLDDINVLELLKTYRPQSTEVDRDLALQLADGSIGEALAVIDAGGLNFYREFIRIVGTLPDIDISAVHTLGDRMARGAPSENFATFSRLVDRWLSGMIRSISTGRPVIESVDGEQVIIERLNHLAGLEEWLEIWEKVKQLLFRAEYANLDRKQVVIGMFHALSSASR